MSDEFNEEVRKNNPSLASKKVNSFSNIPNRRFDTNYLPSTEKLPFEIINFISLLIGIGAFVSYFFIPFYYGLLISVGGVLLSVIFRTRRISGIVVNFFSFFLILIIVGSIFTYNSISKFVKHHIIKKNIECNICEKINF